ncbi:MAG: hypothetical protein WBS19_04695 [Candidatus Korobacteraceae bacterium]
MEESISTEGCENGAPRPLKPDNRKPVAGASGAEVYTIGHLRQPIGIERMMLDRIAACWLMREGKRSRIYGVIAIAGVATGAVSFALSRYRRKVRELEWHADTNHPVADWKASMGGPDPNHALVHNKLAGSHADRPEAAIVPCSPSLSLTQAEELIPAPVGAGASRKEEERQPEREVLPSEAGTSQGLKFSNGPSSAAMQNLWQSWIQTGCALIVILVVWFGVTFARRLTTLIEAQRDSQSATLASQQLSRTEQRAWVGMMDVVPMALRSDGGGFAVKMQNSGRTPAFDVQFSAVITIAENETLMKAEGGGPVTPLGTLLPGAAYSSDVLFRTSPEAVGALVQHRQRAVGWLWVTYTDVFETSHSSRSCFYWYPDLKSVKPCESFNEMR